MDILTHTLSGLAVGTVVSAFSNKGFKERLKIVLISGFAGAIPDIDTISYWPGFDSSIGAFFNLPHSGRAIYSGKLWYSHHAFSHSLVAAFLFTGIIGLITYLAGADFRNRRYGSLAKSVKKNSLLLSGALLGFILHLLEDMPTPSASWGGVNFFWPSESYIGGTGDIWWWNNYDIFLIVLSALVINLILPLIRIAIRFDLRKFTTSVFLIGLTLACIQIKSRDYDFSYTVNRGQYQEFEIKSKALQKDILGDKLFHLMEKMDAKLKLPF